MKFFFILLITICTVVEVTAQTTQTISINMGQHGVSASTLNNLPKQIELEEVIVELTYDYSFLLDTTNVTKVKNEMMLLQVGAKTSKWFSYNSMQVDSLLRAASVEEIIASPTKYAKSEPVEVYKNYPEGEITTIDNVSVDWIRCRESLPEFTWELCGETKEIMGYNCRKAQWKIGGRYWIAWYTEELPIGVGPWKLDGLPGAIIEASDSQEHYTFKLIGVKMSPERKMTLTDIKFIDTSIKQYYKTKRNFIENPLAGLATQGMNVTIIDQSTGKSKSEADLIRKMKYDFIERHK